MRKIVVLVLLMLLVIYGGFIFMNKNRMKGKRWEWVLPELRRRTLRALDKANAAGLSVMFYDGWRSPEESAANIAKGVSHAKDAYSSEHVWGNAVDIVFEKLGLPHWPDASDIRWKKLEEIMNSEGLVRTIFWDKPHFELDNGFTTAAVRKKYGIDYEKYLREEGIIV